MTDRASRRNTSTRFLCSSPPTYSTPLASHIQCRTTERDGDRYNFAYSSVSASQHSTASQSVSRKSGAPPPPCEANFWYQCTCASAVAPVLARAATGASFHAALALLLARATERCPSALALPAVVAFDDDDDDDEGPRLLPHLCPVPAPDPVPISAPIVRARTSRRRPISGGTAAQCGGGSAERMAWRAPATAEPPRAMRGLGPLHTASVAIEGTVCCGGSVRSCLLALYSFSPIDRQTDTWADGHRERETDRET